MGPFRGPNGFMCCVLVPLALVVLCDANPFLKKKACGEPDLPADSAYRCQPPLCQGGLGPGLFKSGTVLEFYCQPGYILASPPGLSICQGGQWSQVQDVICKPQGTSLPPPPSSLLTAASIPLIAAAALTLLAFLVSLLSCALLKPRSAVCRCRSGAYETFEDSDTMEHEELDGTPSGRSGDALPSYEEAIYGHTRTPLLPGDWGPGPLILSGGVLSQPEPLDSSHVAGGALEEGSPPPSYQEALAAAAAESPPGGEQPTRGTAQLSFPLPVKEDGP